MHLSPPKLSMMVLAAALALAQAGAGSPASAPLDVSPWRGKVVLLDFWASWCAPCKQSFPWMSEMARRHADRGLVVVTVNLDESRRDADRFLEDVGGDLQHVFDPEGQIAEAYGVDAMPSSIVLDREGRPVFRHRGFHPEDTGTYEDHLLAALEGRATADGTADAAQAAGGLRPWERGVLARADMQLVSDPLDIAFDDHIYFSKEASSGGRGFGGGGCGCN